MPYVQFQLRRIKEVDAWHTKQSQLLSEFKGFKDSRGVNCRAY